MENRSIFIAFLVVWAVYVPAIYVAIARMRISLLLASVSHLVPTTIALTMIRIFLVGHGATVRQFVAGSDSGTDLWSLWVGLWPLFLLAAIMSAAVHGIATLVAAFKPGARRYLVVSIPGVLMAILTFFAVAANFPDA